MRLSSTMCGAIPHPSIKLNPIFIKRRGYGLREIFFQATVFAFSGGICSVVRQPVS